MLPLAQLLLLLELLLELFEREEDEEQGDASLGLLDWLLMVLLIT